MHAEALVKQGADPKGVKRYLRFIEKFERVQPRKGLHAHHIVPRCLGGLTMGVVHLTRAQHIKAHELLARALPDVRLKVAVDLLKEDRAAYLKKPVQIEEPYAVDYSKMKLIVGPRFNTWVPIV